MVTHIDSYIQQIARWSKLKRFAQQRAVIRKLERYRKNLLDLFFAAIAVHYIVSLPRPSGQQNHIATDNSPTTPGRPRAETGRGTDALVRSASQMRNRSEEQQPAVSDVRQEAFETSQDARPDPKSPLPEHGTSMRNPEEAALEQIGSQLSARNSRWLKTAFKPEATRADISRLLTHCAQELVEKLDDAGLLTAEWCLDFDSQPADRKAHLFMKLCQRRHHDRDFRTAVKTHMRMNPDMSHLVRPDSPESSSHRREPSEQAVSGSRPRERQSNRLSHLDSPPQRSLAQFTTDAGPSLPSNGRRPLRRMPRGHRSLPVSRSAAIITPVEPMD
ncbi:hypothetical protein DFH06DRAFT_134004 [Mycena polygramma]|nr:hypothetical protein DFH06DRAFT_134004 [Mycena polygramma]